LADAGVFGGASYDGLVALESSAHGRTLLTLDRDYLDDRRFPPEEGAGVIVFSVPDERWLRRLLTRMDRELFRTPDARALPLERRKVEWHTDAQPGS